MMLEENDRNLCDGLKKAISPGILESYRRNNHVLAVNRKGNQADCTLTDQERTEDVSRKRSGT